MILQQKLSPATSFLWPRDSFGCDFSSTRHPPSLSIPFSFCYPLSDFYFFLVSWDVTLPSLTPKAQAAANFSLSSSPFWFFISEWFFFFFPLQNWVTTCLEVELLELSLSSLLLKIDCGFNGWIAHGLLELLVCFSIDFLLLDSLLILLHSHQLNFNMCISLGFS